jgi:hypothetical protein
LKQPELWKYEAIVMVMFGLGPTLAGCSLSAGPMTGVMAEKGIVNVGGKLDGHVYLSQTTAGVIAGVEGQVASKVDGNCPCSQWRSIAELGYGKPPTTLSTPVGWELLLLGGLGRMPDGEGRVSLAGATGLQFALPVRLAQRRELWQADDYVGTRLELAPDVTALLAVPTNSATANVELSVGLTVRGYLYAAVLP